MDRFYNDILTFVRSLSSLEKFGIIAVGIIVSLILLASFVQLTYNPRFDPKFRLPLILSFIITVAITVWFGSVIN